MFHKARLWERFRTKFEDDKFSNMLRDVIGEDTALGSEKLRTLLMMVLRNATTDSPWPLSNNPAAKYNDAARADCNLKLPLWQLVRASTAAPTYFPPEVVHIGRDFIFVDGGVTTYNNPAFQLFLMATSEPYHLLWPTGLSSERTSNVRRSGHCRAAHSVAGRPMLCRRDLARRRLCGRRSAVAAESCLLWRFADRRSQNVRSWRRLADRSWAG